MGQSDPEYTEFGTVLADGGDRFAVSAISFDTQEELLWMGNEGVRTSLLSMLNNLRSNIYRATSPPTMVQECKNTRHSKCMQLRWFVKS